MKSSRKDFSEIDKLIELSIEGSISPEQAQFLNDQLVNDNAVCRHYCEYIYLTVCIKRMSIKLPASDLQEYNMVLDQELWSKLAQEEKNAPVIEIATPEEPEILVQKAQSHKVVHKISKTSIFSLYATAAAIILIFAFAYFVPPATGIKVAVLSDSIHAKWADADGAMEKGASIFTSRNNLFLKEGFAELLFDNKARVTLEGPVEFQILTNDQIRLQCGRLYAVVPQEAIGFTITTQSAKVIDLGTEFGVESDVRGDAYLHVIKGKTTLIGSQNSNKVSMEVGKGCAKKVSAQISAISDIPCNATLFVRKIDSKNGMIWRGQKQIHLADIVAGGNGFGTEKLDMGIDPITGTPAQYLWKGDRQSANDYRPTPSNPYIDGVFVPNGKTPQCVSSQGHLFLECPPTDGLCSQIIKGVTDFDSGVLENISDPQAMSPHLYLHANMGITFDLNAMRRSLPGAHIERFQSKCGMRRHALKAGNADFWVLVDGKVRFKQEQVKPGEVHSVDIELSEKDLFLTLVATDGGNPADRIMDGQAVPAIEGDWGIFADSVLLLQ